MTLIILSSNSCQETTNPISDFVEQSRQQSLNKNGKHLLFPAFQVRCFSAASFFVFFFEFWTVLENKMCEITIHRLNKKSQKMSTELLIIKISRLYSKGKEYACHC